MSRSSPGPPKYLLPAIRAVERVLAEHYPEPMTAREVTDVLRTRNYKWPLRPTFDMSQGSHGEPTPARVKRVCELGGNRTVIDRVLNPDLYSIYDWAIEKVRNR